MFFTLVWIKVILHTHDYW